MTSKAEEPREVEKLVELGKRYGVDISMEFGPTGWTARYEWEYRSRGGRRWRVGELASGPSKPDVALASIEPLKSLLRRFSIRGAR